jgi:hypothetical protein
MGTCKTWISSRLHIGSITISHLNKWFFINHKKIANTILFADDTSIVISDTSPEEFKSNISLVLNETINWFQSNFLTLNCDKTHFLQLITKK